MQLEVGARSRQVLIRSLAPMARAVGAGLGPYGRVTLHGNNNDVRVLRTGSDVSRFFADNAGPLSLAPRLVKDIAMAAERDLGDGTARLVILLCALLKAGDLQIAAGIPPRQLADSLPVVVREFTDRLGLRRLPEPAFGLVARAAGADPALADTLADLAVRVGAGGNLEVIENDGPGIASQSGEGFVFDAESVSRALPPISLDPVSILVANERIDDFGQLAPFLDAFATGGKALLVVARDVTGPALQALVQNRLKIGLRAVALRPTAVTDEAVATLEDLAIAVGAQVIGAERGTSLDVLRPSMLGRAARFSFSNGRATLTAAAGNADAAAIRRRQILAEADARKYLALDRERLLRRAGRLAGQWGELRVGGLNAYETDANMRVARRAAAAVRSAMDGGVIAGGTAAMMSTLEELGARPSENRAAYDCLASALRTLHRAIQRNAPEANSLASLARSAAPAAGPDLTIQDPFALTAAVLDRAASGAAALLHAEALLSKT